MKKTNTENNRQYGGGLSPFLRLMRPHQYAKNVLIFLPAFFALKLFERDVWLQGLGTFLAFSLLASAVYVLNDLLDIESDRKHPTKKMRPLASGEVSPRSGIFLLLLLLGAGLGALLALSAKSVGLGLCYFVINLAYTFRLKHIAIIDLFSIASGFVIRIVLGAVAAAVPLSMWIILMTFLLALFLGLAKRRDDVLLSLHGNRVRKSIDGYNLEFINGAMIIMASVLIVAYLSYVISPEVQAKHNSQELYITVVFVILGILRYLQISFVEQKSGSPTRVFLQDHFLQLTILAWLLTFGILIYLPDQVLGL